MEKEKASKVGCQACKNSRKIKNLEISVYLFGGSVLLLSIYGLISLNNDIKSFF